MAKKARTIGSLETWEPEDKSFSKHILTEGSGNITPNQGAICDVLITMLGDPVISDDALGSYALGKNCEVTIGEGDTECSELFDTVVTHMHEGETCYVKSKIGADGKRVDDMVLGSEEGLKFNVELHGFSRAADNIDLANDELLERAVHHKESGTALFHAGRVPFAVKRYQVALQCLLERDALFDIPQRMRAEIQHLMELCHVNLAACFLKMQDYVSVEDQATSALRVNDECVKARYRRALARIALHRYEDARLDLQVALQSEPKNTAIAGELAKLKTLIKGERKVYQKMFGQEIST